MTRVQLPLALKPPRRPVFDNFICGNNRAVVRTLRDGLESGQWYFLAGPAGSGRTHLLSAVFTARLAEAGTALFIAAADRYKRTLLDHAEGRWILVDDVDALAGDRDGEQMLFNALNRWRAARTGVIMSGRGRDRFALPDLRSRLGQAIRLTLEPLDEDGLAELIAALAAEQEVALGRGVSEYLLSRAPRNAGQLARLLEDCTRRALAERRTLSIPLVREELARVG